MTLDTCDHISIEEVRKFWNAYTMHLIALSKLLVILSERGPRRILQHFRGPHEQVFVRGVEAGGGESKACP